MEKVLLNADKLKSIFRTANDTYDIDTIWFLNDAITKFIDYTNLYIVSDDGSKHKAYAYIDDNILFIYPEYNGDMLYAPKYCTLLFNTLKVSNIYFDNFNTYSVVTMRKMFNCCDNITYLDLSKFNTTNVEDMSYMFLNMKKLTRLDVKFDTSSVLKMAGMFKGCYNLRFLDISTFNTQKVETMESMFSECVELIDIKFGCFYTKRVEDMSYMFKNCYKIEKIDTLRFDTSRVLFMEAMFKGCKKLKKLNLSSFKTSKVTTYKFMFTGCTSLTELNIRNFNISDNAYILKMCSNCQWLEKVILPNNLSMNKIVNESVFEESCAVRKLVQ